MTRQELDHARYLNHRDERLKKQREYYRANKDKYTWRHLYEVYEKHKNDYETKTRQSTEILGRKVQ